MQDPRHNKYLIVGKLRGIGQCGGFWSSGGISVRRRRNRISRVALLQRTAIFGFAASALYRSQW